MDQLRTLAMEPGWIYEVVVSTFSDGLPHAAPIGVWTDDSADSLHMEIYRGSQTLSNILANECLVANFPTDVQMLSTSLLTPQQLAYRLAQRVKAPVLRDASATVELVLDRATALPDRVHVAAVAVHTDRRRDLRLINRADGLLLESLILATRIERLDRSFVTTVLTENYRVVCKVAPGSSSETALRELVRSLGLHS